MRLQVVTVMRQKGVGAKSQRAYDFLIVGGLVSTARGTEFAEVMLDGAHPVPELGKSYDMEINAFPDREKRLQFRVEALRAVSAAKAA